MRSTRFPLRQEDHLRLGAVRGDWGHTSYFVYVESDDYYYRVSMRDFSF